MRSDRLLVVGGLGAPHDDFAAAALRSRGFDAVPLGPLDADAFERGRSSLPRGQCAPAIYTSGALVRRALRASPSRALSFLSVESCGPCRFAAFEHSYRRALATHGARDVSFLRLEQSTEQEAFELRDLRHVVESMAVADAWDACVRRLLPHVEDLDAFERACAQAVSRIALRIARGDDPVASTVPEARWLASVPRVAPRPLGRAFVVGDPWSLHVHGDGQLRLPRTLARVGIETEIPPFALWIRLLLSEARKPWGTRAALPRHLVAAAEELESDVRATLEAAARALGAGPIDLPDVDALEALAAPYLPASFRGGYGSLEVGLALRAAIDRRAHVVLSVKSFGCIPSGGVSDAILPIALAGRLPFLSIEVSGDGEAPRESRLTMRAADALSLAGEELRAACSSVRRCPSRAGEVASDPLAAVHELGTRPYACALACDVARAGGL